MCAETRRKISVPSRNCRDAAQGVVEIIAVEFAGRQIVPANGALKLRLLEQIPLRFEHSRRGERSSCILLPENRQLYVRSCAPDAGSFVQPPCASEPSLC